MNDHDFDTRLNDYLDGLLSAEEAARFEAELARDADAAAELDALRGLMAETAALPRAIEPERDGWAAIEARLAPRRSNVFRARFGLWGLALAAAAVAVFGVWTMNRLPEAVLSPEAPVPAMTAWHEQYGDAERSYQNARTGLVEALAAREVEMHPDTRAVLDENLDIIDGAMKEIMAAIESDPENPVLVRKLMATREKELNLLETMLYVPAGV